jgi:protein-tyrosine phosphatase
LARAGLPLSVLPGSEIQVNDVAAYRRDYTEGIYCHLGDNPGYTLLELPWRDRFYPAGVADLVRWLGEQGTQVILAHPERYDYFQADPPRLRNLVEAGAWLQITVDSLLGNHGTLPQAAGEELLRTYPQALLATDTHNTSRCSGLSKGYALVRERFGLARAADLEMRANRILQHLLIVERPPTEASGMH